MTDNNSIPTSTVANQHPPTQPTPTPKPLNGDADLTTLLVAYYAASLALRCAEMDGFDGHSERAGTDELYRLDAEKRRLAELVKGKASQDANALETLLQWVLQ